MSEKCEICGKELVDGQVRFYIAISRTECTLEDALFLMCICSKCMLKILCMLEEHNRDRQM